MGRRRSLIRAPLEVCWLNCKFECLAIHLLRIVLRARDSYISETSAMNFVLGPLPAQPQHRHSVS